MIHVSNIRKESADGWTRLVADITYQGGGVLPSLEPVIWLAVKDENAHMLADDVYDAFVLVPLYLAMYFKQDLHIHGNVSKRLYKNIMNYLQRILCDFSPDLSRVNVTADGFAEAAGNQSVIGTGISCGVDSLTTIYDRYVMEDDPDYRVNGLFFFNCGTHGTFSDKSRALYMERYNMNKRCADELGLPIYQVDTNLRAFTYQANDPGNGKAGYLAIWSCVLGLGRAVRRYYVSSCYSYRELETFGRSKHDTDFAAYSESYSVPLIRTERLELIIDGSQYERNAKTERIASWDITRKYLNVCGLYSDVTDSAKNCSQCKKCLRTLFALEALCRLDDFAGVFDLDTYRRHSFRNKCDVVVSKYTDAHKLDNYNLARSHGLRLPSYPVAWLYLLPFRMAGLAKKALRRIIGRKRYESLKSRIKHNHSS